MQRQHNGTVSVGDPFWLNFGRGILGGFCVCEGSKSGWILFILSFWLKF
jgi:hypothetical protein